MSPIRPREFEAVISQAEDSLGVKIIRFVKFMVLFVRYQLWKFTITGEFSEDYKKMICEACPKPTDTTDQTIL